MENLEASSDILATNRILYGQGGYGYGNNGIGVGNSLLAAEAHANGTADSAKADCNALRFSDGLSDLRNNFNQQTRGAQFDTVNKNITDAEFRSSDRATGAEFRSLDRQRDIERMLVDNAKDAAACCCETQKLITAEATSTRALILEVEGRANVAQLAAAHAKITQLETINALSK